jgi:hypothetical protein
VDDFVMHTEMLQKVGKTFTRRDQPGSAINECNGRKVDAPFKEDREVNFGERTLSYIITLGLTQPSIQWVPVALSLGVKWPWREADHTPPSSAEVKE